jgi:hypothetical protein
MPLVHNSLRGHNEWDHKGVDFEPMQELQTILKATLCLL